MKKKALLTATSVLLIANLTLPNLIVAQCTPPTINPVGNQIVCMGSNTTTINFSGTGTAYSWTNNNPSIGLAASGRGNIPSFIAINNGTLPVTATITVTPTTTNASAGNVYISNNLSDSVSVIDIATNVITATIGIGAGPTGESVSSDGSRLYVSNSQDNSVSVVNTATNSVIATVSVGSNPYTLTVTPDGSMVYVANYYDNTVSVINTAADTVMATIPVGSSPNSTAVSPDGSRVYVANNASQSISVINTATNVVSATIPVGNYPEGLIVTPDSKWLYVDDRDDNAVIVINTTTNAITATIILGTNPNGIAVSPDGSRIYTTNLSTNTVSVINTATNTVSATIGVGDWPAGVSVSADGSMVYVANYYGNTVSAIKTSTNTIIATIGVGGGPFCLGNFITGGNCIGTPATFSITVNPEASTPVITQSGDSLIATVDTSYRYYQWYEDTVLIPNATKYYYIFNHNDNYNLAVKNIYGCLTSVGINVVGIENISINSFNIYPNPATHQLILTGLPLQRDMKTLEVFDVIGKKLYSTKINESDITIDVSNIPQGVYYIRLEANGENVVRKFIKE